MSGNFTFSQGYPSQNYSKVNDSKLESVQKQKSKVELTPFTLYKEAYTINLLSRP